MQIDRHKPSNPERAGVSLRRIAITVSLGLLVTAAMLLPLGTSRAGLLASPAFAAGDGDGAAGSSGGFHSAVDDATATANTESGEDSAESVLVPAASNEKSTPKVIKEVGRVTGDTELSTEEELEAIRNGWGTWRTADGPESVIAQ